MSDALLACRGMTLTLGETPVVRNLDLSLKSGEIFALVGESGCGKTLTALALMRLLPPAVRQIAGTVTFAGVDLSILPEIEMRQLRGRKLAMIFQEPSTSLNPVLTIGEQLAEAIRLGGEMPTPASLAARLADVGMPDPERRLAEYPFQLSGGMKQRAMIAMALASSPRLLIADEPTTALDVTIQAQVLDLLAQRCRQQAMTMLLITHDLGIVAEMADRVGVMYAGELVETAPSARFFACPTHPYAARLLAALPEAAPKGRPLATIPGQPPASHEVLHGCRFAPRCEKATPLCRERAPYWREVASGHGVRCHFPLRREEDPAVVTESRPAIAAAETSVSAAFSPVSSETALLAVEKLAVYYPIRKGVFQRVKGWVRAVDGIDLMLSRARTLALVGESGCGKTTAGKAILGLIAPTRGRLLWQGQPLSGLAPKRMQMVFQDPFASLNPRQRVGRSIGEGNPSANVGELLRRVGLSPAMADRYPHEFSGGQRQRLAIARALSMQPQLLILDEPTSALDVSVQAQILNLFEELQRELGLAYLFISHNLAAVARLAHDVGVMYLGRIVEYGPAQDVLSRPRHPYTEALLAAAPRLDGGGMLKLATPGDPPSPANPPPGCHFAPRCPRAHSICHRQAPPTVQIAPCHRVSCWLADLPSGRV
ncbi:MAG: ABC transporter ATP-binding protein [Rhodocyclaceae bacterium]|nr:ABC transporter ATP-binding protein [Rhodocyclaceae bacterium]